MRRNKTMNRSLVVSLAVFGTLLLGASVAWLFLNREALHPAGAATAAGGSAPISAPTGDRRMVPVQMPQSLESSWATTSAAPRPRWQAGAHDRAYANEVRRTLRERKQTSGASSVRSPNSPAMLQPAVLPTPPPDTSAGAQRRRDEIRNAVKEQYFPMVRTCYETLLAKSPRAAGEFKLEFSIVGDAAVGGVVENVRLGEGTTLTDPELLSCLTESLYGTLFDPPPEGVTEITVGYPISLAP